MRRRRRRRSNGMDESVGGVYPNRLIAMRCLEELYSSTLRFFVKAVLHRHCVTIILVMRSRLIPRYFVQCSQRVGMWLTLTTMVQHASCSRPIAEDALSRVRRI
jgi:hypothetical protein